MISGCLPLFIKLKIWMAEQSDNSRLVSLKSTGRGVLFLYPVESPFKLMGRANRQLGQMSHAFLALFSNRASRGFTKA